jgi:hypothetical protein
MTLLLSCFAIGLSVLVCAMFLLKRRSDPYSIAVTCLPMLLLPVFLTSMFGVRAVVHGFQTMAETGLGMEEAVSGLELGNRVYFLGHAASGVPLIVLLVVGGASLLRSEAKRDRSKLRTGIVVAVAAISTASVLAVSPLQTRSILYPLVGLTAFTQHDVSEMPITREAGQALEEEINDPNALSGRISKNVLYLSISAFVLFWLSVLGFVAGIVLGRGTGMARPVAVFGLVLTAVAIVVVCVQAYRHHAIGDEIGQVASAQGTNLQQD